MEEDILQQYAADPKAVAAPKNAELAEITKLARKQIRLQASVVKAEEKLRAAQAALDAVEGKALPEAMLAVGLTEFTLKNKSRVKIADVIRAAIPKARLPEALTWLVQHHQEGLIKGTVEVNFGLKKGETFSFSAMKENAARLELIAATYLMPNLEND